MAKNRTKYVNNYNKEHTVQYPLRFNKDTDADIIEHLKQFKSRAGYIKDLIREDIKRTVNLEK